MLGPLRNQFQEVQLLMVIFQRVGQVIQQKILNDMSSQIMVKVKMHCAHVDFPIWNSKTHDVGNHLFIGPFHYASQTGHRFLSTDIRLQKATIY